jgi:hypothetical protein
LKRLSHAGIKLDPIPYDISKMCETIFLSLFISIHLMWRFFFKTNTNFIIYAIDQGNSSGKHIHYNIDKTIATILFLTHEMWAKCRRFVTITLWHKRHQSSFLFF